MATPEQANQKQESSKKDKPDFSGFLRAINVDRLNPANSHEKPLMLKRPINAHEEKVNNVRMLQATGVLVSAMWLVGAAFYVQRMVGWSNISGLMPHEMGGFLAGILTPVALFWMIAAFILRSNDVKLYAEALREEIQGMIFPSEEANRRVNNDIERLMRQTAEMSKATRIALGAIETARDGLKNQVNLMNDGSVETVERLTSLGNTLNARMQDAATMGAALEDTLAKIEQSAGAAEQKLGATNDQLQQSAALIGTQTSSTEEAVGRLSQLLRERLEALGNLHQETETALEKAATEIALQREGLKVETGALEQQAYNVGDALQKGVDKLYSFTDDALDKAKLIETKLNSQSASLQNVLDQSNNNASTIESATANAAANLQKAADNITEGTSNIGDVLQHAITRLEDRTNANVQSVKDKMDEAALALNKDMDAATAQALENIANAQAQLTDATQGMVKDLDDVAARATGNADDIQDDVEAAIKRLIEEMDQAGVRTGDAFSNVHQTIDDASQKLNDTVDAVLKRANDTASTVETKIEAAGERIGNEIDGLGQRALENVQTIQQVMEAATRNLNEDIDALGNRASDNAKNVQTVIEQSTIKMGQDIDVFGQRAVDNTKNVQSMIEQAAAKLGNDIDTFGQRATDRVQNIQTVIEDTTRNLNDNIDNAGNRASENVKAAQGLMEQATQRLITDVDAVGQRAKSMTDTMLNEVNRKVTDTTAAFAYIQTQIQALVGLFDQRKLQLDETGASARQTAEAMQSTLQSALDKVQKTADTLQSGIGAIQLSVSEPIKLLENAATMAHQRAGDITEILNSQTNVMLETGKKLGEDVINAQQQMYTKNQDIALLAGKIASHLKSVGMEMEAQNSALDTRLNLSLQTLDTLNDSQKKVVQNLEKLQEQTASAADQTNLSTETIQQRIEVLQQLHNALAKDASESKGELDRVSDRLIHISSATVDKIKNTIENMTLLEADYHRLSDAGIDSIGRLETGYRDTLNIFQTETEKTIDNVVAMQSGLEEKTLQTNQAVEAHLASLQQTIENIDETVHKVTDFGDTIALHTSRIQDLGNHFSTGNEQISINISSIKDAVTEIKDFTIEAVDGFMQQGQNLEQQMQMQMTRLNDVNQNFIYHSKDAKAALEQSVDETENLTQKIQDQVGKIRSESESTESVLAALFSKLTDANQKFTNQREDLQSTGTAVMENLQQATQQISNKAAELERAALAAQQQAEVLRDQERKLNEEAFFNSTKFIVESLHSLALDFTRMLEGELNEKTWRGYQKGDVGSFTRRLLSTRDEETQNKIRNKFKEDIEFRTYVQRYLRQFEEIYDSADKNDHAHLLTSIFMTSDVGKLYQFVCTILERDARGVTKS